MGPDSSSIATRVPSGAMAATGSVRPGTADCQALPVAQRARLRVVDLTHGERGASGVGERRDRHPLALSRLEVGERVGVLDGEPADPGAAQRGEVAAAAERGAEVAGQRPHVGARRHGHLDVDVEHRDAVRLLRRAPHRSRSATP